MLQNNKLLLGKVVSEHIKNKFFKDIKELHSYGIVPKLAAVLVGDDPASKIYVNTKHKTFLKYECSSEIYHLKDNSKEKEILTLLDDLNNDNDVHGILVQFPLPPHLDANKVISFINPKKDVDGLHPLNLGYLMQGNPKFIPCTPLGCIEILKHYNINVNSKDVVIIGRSNLVGKPLFSLLSQRFKFGNGTVTLCHSATKNLKMYTKNADIIIVAVGSPQMLTEDMIKSDSIIIDVGINRVDDNSEKGYHIVGDVDFDNMIHKVSYITPVPGGVGPMTITMLLNNTILSAKKQSGKFPEDSYL